MDRLTRQDLKSDKFVQEVAHTVGFLEQHKAAVIRYAVLALVLIVAGVGIYYFLDSRRATRQADLARAMKTYNALVTPTGDGRSLTFPTQEARQEAIKKEMGEVLSKHSGSEEAAIASYLLGVNAADQGDLDEAVKRLQAAAKDGGSDYAPLARLALADVYSAQGKTADAEKELRAIIANPSPLASKELATLTLARILAKSNPDEARKLLEPLRSETGAASRAAISLLAEINQPQ
ncbi:MAG TPA: tetratricopeptide repeat protein [Bryobacteraceae bacterium]|nr:tetratricopeptide repeat protein [Bryobacteraceae bacterium]